MLQKHNVWQYQESGEEIGSGSISFKIKVTCLKYIEWKIEFKYIESPEVRFIALYVYSLSHHLV